MVSEPRVERAGKRGERARPLDFSQLKNRPKP